MTPFMRSVCLALVAAAAGTLRGESPSDAGKLRIYWNDVEGGGSTLIVTPAGESVLIDSGNPGTRDAGRIYQDATQVAGLKKIDYYITTHFHLDHFGGIAALSAQIPIGQVYDNGIPQHDPDFSPSDALWIKTSQPYRSFAAGGRNLTQVGLILPLKQSAGAAMLQFQCIASRQKFIAAPAGTAPNPLASENTHHELAPTDNDNSSAWVLDFGPFRFFDGGDLTWNKEGELVTPLNRVGRVDVYQTDHHGLARSNNPVLIHSLAPTIAVMNNGITKGTEHSTIEGLRSSPGIQAIYQMHKNLRPEDPEDNTTDDLIANHGKDPNHADAHYIKLVVEPSGDAYTVTIDGGGPPRRYETRLSK